jgi:hypothetical protein
MVFVVLIGAITRKTPSEQRLAEHRSRPVRREKFKACLWGT